MTDRDVAQAGPGGCLSEFLQGRRRGLTAALVFVLCGSIVLPGCKATSSLTGPTGLRGQLSSGKDIRVTLNTGDMIDLKAYSYAEVRVPADFVSGTGWRINGLTGQRETFRGRITPPSLEPRDTIITETDYNGALAKVEQRYSDFTLPDSGFVRFRAGEFVVVRETDGPGFYYAAIGTRTDPQASRTKMIPLEDIYSIEETSFSAGKTAEGAVVYTALASVAALVLLVTFLWIPLHER